MLKKFEEVFLAKIGVLFSNLGTPDDPTPKAVGRYLAEFLMDPYVIQIPSLLRTLLVRGIIVPFRSKKSAKNYEEVWTSNGSPLLVETNKAAEALQEVLGDGYKVVVGMRYGNPSFEQARKELADCEDVIFFPQYPQYAESTVQTGLDHWVKHFPKFKDRVVAPYYDNPHFISSYVTFLKEALVGVDHDHLLMSFHGLPESHLEKTDPTKSHCLKSKDCCEKAQGEVLKSCYRAQCYGSARALAQGMNLDPSQYSVSFQSRLGRQKWIEPYTEEMYGALVKRGVKKLAVICPGFSVDGLETLEEIAMSGKEMFLQQGGEEFTFVPCLNDHKAWIQACAKILKET